MDSIQADDINPSHQNTLKTLETEPRLLKQIAATDETAKSNTSSVASQDNEKKLSEIRSQNEQIKFEMNRNRNERGDIETPINENKDMGEAIVPPLSNQQHCANFFINEGDQKDQRDQYDLNDRNECCF